LLLPPALQVRLSPTVLLLSEKALQLALRAIWLFEQETETKKAELESEEVEADKPFIPSGVRLYYIAGGILLRTKRYQDAIPYLEKAASGCAKWDGLELSFRKMLVECYSHYMPSPPSDAPSEITDSNMLDVLFHSGLQLSEIWPVLESYCSGRGGGSLKWNLESTDSDMSLPFSFSVTFPGSTHATAGDTVTSVVTIKSNLDYPLHVKSVTLKSATGKINVPSSDLTDALNAEKGLEGGIILPPMTAVLFSTDIELPRDLERIASDESSSGNPGVSARPRTAGITSAGKSIWHASLVLCWYRPHAIKMSQLALAWFLKIALALKTAMVSGGRACSAESRSFATVCHFCLPLNMAVEVLLHDTSRWQSRRRSPHRSLPPKGHRSKRTTTSKWLGPDRTTSP